MDNPLEVRFKDLLIPKNSEQRSLLLTKEQYYELISELKEAFISTTKSNRQYYILGHYEILKCGDVDKLIRKRMDNSEDPIYFAHINDMFDIIKRAHIQTGHGGRDKMTRSLTNYENITRESIELYKSLCDECQKKRKRPTTKGVVVRPILSKDFLSRDQVDLIDMQSMSYQSNKWILVNQDHLTKYCVLRHLTSKRAAGVAYQLIDISMSFGAPQILQSTNSQDILTDSLEEMHHNIGIQRKRARDCLVVQSERVVQRSRLEQVAGDPGDNLTIPIPLVDRGKGAHAT